MRHSSYFCGRKLKNNKKYKYHMIYYHKQLKRSTKKPPAEIILSRGLETLD
jgi:hypothetical protein